MLEQIATALGIKKFFIGALGGGIATLFVAKISRFKMIGSILISGFMAYFFTGAVIAFYPMFKGLESALGFFIGLFSMNILALLFHITANPAELLKMVKDIFKR